MKLLLIYLIPLWTFTSVQQEVRDLNTGTTEILDAKIDVVAYSNKICFVGKITECHYIVVTYKNEYTLANRMKIRVHESRIIVNDDYENVVLYKEKQFEN